MKTNKKEWMMALVLMASASAVEQSNPERRGYYNGSQKELQEQKMALGAIPALSAQEQSREQQDGKNYFSRRIDQINARKQQEQQDRKNYFSRRINQLSKLKQQRLNLDNIKKLEDMEKILASVLGQMGGIGNDGAWEYKGLVDEYKSAQNELSKRIEEGTRDLKGDEKNPWMLAQGGEEAWLIHNENEQRELRKEINALAANPKNKIFITQLDEALRVAEAREEEKQMKKLAEMMEWTNEDEALRVAEAREKEKQMKKLAEIEALRVAEAREKEKQIRKDAMLARAIDNAEKQIPQLTADIERLKQEKSTLDGSLAEKLAEQLAAEDQGDEDARQEIQTEMGRLQEQSAEKETGGKALAKQIDMLKSRVDINAFPLLPEKDPYLTLMGFGYLLSDEEKNEIAKDPRSILNIMQYIEGVYGKKRDNQRFDSRSSAWKEMVDGKTDAEIEQQILEITDQATLQDALDILGLSFPKSSIVEK